MTWKNLLKQNRVQKHVTSKAELDNLRSVVARDIQDAAIDSLSDDLTLTPGSVRGESR